MDDHLSSIPDVTADALPEVVLAEVVLGDGTRTRLASRHADVRRVFLDGGFSRSLASAAAGASGPLLSMSMTELDPPAHTRARDLVAASWSVRSVNQARGRLEQTAEALVDALCAAGPPAELVEAYCGPFSFAAHFEILGVPAEHRGPLRALLESRTVQVLEGVSRERVHADELSLYEEMTRALEAKRAQPGGGMLDALVVARDRDGVIDETEMRGIAASFLLDGPFLAATQIANALACLLSDRRRAELLRESPELMRSAVEELLRFEPSVNHSLCRVATADVPLGSGTVAAGETVTALPPCANRDPAVFQDPTELDLGRAVNPHLTFGRGAHSCLGAHLMRLELRISLELLLRRLPGLRLEVPSDDLRRFVTQGARGVLALPASW